ncbi:protein kinase domain-containing protein [Rhodococcus wratislaviensis]|uniref:Putative serine/threonine protein kinase n=1 Tax=Rhodococcus wratislaviensis NBRC 100605 TaxID=1219028 RepID=X0PYS3_RHOWR|nr:protein kinase [Rhodococcus wratislaviensis]GAF43577.1 putative serine/threonine protein kinase [Rhodococcus wratislaviensis NBRC 100605]
MGEVDPQQTQRDIVSAITAELGESGFEDAREIGRGGFGVVYRCTQTTLDRTVAVKVLTSDIDQENRARFFREQRVMGRLTGHPNIVNVLQVGATASGHPFLVMPYYPQDSLEARLHRHGPLTDEEALRLGVKAAGALETAHRMGIVHRDVKPGNILVTDYGEPLLTDFGIAHVVGGFQTVTGAVTGSPAFTAPEVLAGKPSSPAADVYGLGATLFAALTGHAAFERRSGEQVVAQFLRITSGPAPDLRTVGVYDDLSGVVEQAMSRDPRERPTAAALGEALQDIQSRRGVPVDEMALRAEPGAGGDEGDPVPLTPERPGTRRPLPNTSSPRGVTGNLPLELTSFVDRRLEVKKARTLFASSRVVTLTGIGGVGKTRLALRVAENERRAFHDGVRMVELGELRDPSLVVEVVAATLGLRNRTARPLSELLVEFLIAQELLLVLDNCEQVIDAVGELADTLLRACPGVRILATSREPLGIGGEAVLQVAPLPVPDPGRTPSVAGLPSYDAMTLFADRGAAVVPGFVITEDNAATVAKICQRLDGLPLAIELAAARLRALAPEQILQRLTDQFGLLTHGCRGAPTRQQTLRWSIDWSYELCTPAEQQIWARVSVFAGSFELDAAQGVCGEGMEPDVLLDVLESLVDKSILIREQPGAVVRFRMLETLRDYGRDKAQQAGEYLQLGRRHRNWYRRLALDAETDWISPRQLDWIARLDREQPNLREALAFSLSGDEDPESALSFAAALYPFWFTRGLLSEGRHWLDRGLARPTGETSPVRAKALYLADGLADMQGDLEAAAARVAEVRAIADQTADPIPHAFAALAEVHHALHTGDLPRACTPLEVGIEVFDVHGDLVTQLTALLTLGWAYEVHGDTPRLLACQEKVLTITEAHGESVYRSHALFANAIATWRQGDRDRPVRQLKEGLRLSRERNDPFVARICLEALAWIAGADGRARHATVLMGAAQALGQLVGSAKVVFPNLIVHHEECERVARQTLGDRTFEATLREGSSMDFDAAADYAVGEEHKAAVHTSGPSTELTKRERQVASLVAEGLSNRAIAARLVISQRTAQGHVEHILVKLGFTSRAQIAAWEVERGLNEQN